MSIRYIGIVTLISLLAACGGGTVGTGVGLPPVKPLVDGFPAAEPEQNLLQRLLKLTKPVKMDVSVVGECALLFKQTDSALFERNRLQPPNSRVECEGRIHVTHSEQPVSKAFYVVESSSCSGASEEWTSYASGSTSIDGRSTFPLPIRSTADACQLRVTLPEYRRVQSVKIILGK